MRRNQRRYIEYAKLYRTTAKEKAEYRRAGIDFYRQVKKRQQTDKESPF